MIAHVDDTNFEAEVLNWDRPVLVDFYMLGCGPCINLEPRIKNIASVFSPLLKVVKLNTDRARNTTMDWNIMVAPTIIVFKAGRAVYRFEGLPSERQLTDIARAHT
jgi:thioredoxin 1